MKRLEIFRTGRHVAANGEALDFGQTELDQIVGSYDPKVHEAPLVVGHPKTDAPAYGWVQSLSTTPAGVLEAAPAQVHPDFAELVRLGRFKKISMSVYRPDSPTNPKPGSWYLRHVGFLGAQPPAVKGLRDAAFAASEEGVVEFAEVDAPVFLSSLRQLLADQLGEDVVRQAFAMAATDPNADPAATDPNAPAAPADLAERRRRTGALEQRMTKLERDIAERERALRRREHVSFLEELVRGGQPLPAKVPLLIAIMERLDAAPADAASFGEGETRTASQIFREEVLAKLPKRVAFGELSAPDPDEDEELNGPRAVAREAIAFQEEQAAKGIVISTGDAVRHVKRKRAR